MPQADSGLMASRQEHGAHGSVCYRYTEAAIEAWQQKLGITTHDTKHMHGTHKSSIP